MAMDRDILLVLAGGAVAIASSVATALLKDWLDARRAARQSAGQSSVAQAQLASQFAASIQREIAKAKAAKASQKPEQVAGE